jgi:hypothetical protein
MYSIYQINDSIYKTKKKINVHNPQHDKYLIFEHTNVQNKWPSNSVAYILQGVSETVLKQTSQKCSFSAL